MADKRKRYVKHITRNGQRIKVQRYEGDSNWTVVES